MAGADPAERLLKLPTFAGVWVTQLVAPLVFQHWGPREALCTIMETTFETVPERMIFDTKDADQQFEPRCDPHPQCLYQLIYYYKLSASV